MNNPLNRLCLATISQDPMPIRIDISSIPEPAKEIQELLQNLQDQLTAMETAFQLSGTGNIKNISFNIGHTQVNVPATSRICHLLTLVLCQSPQNPEIRETIYNTIRFTERLKSMGHDNQHQSWNKRFRESLMKSPNQPTSQEPIDKAIKVFLESTDCINQQTDQKPVDKGIKLFLECTASIMNEAIMKLEERGYSNRGIIGLSNAWMDGEWNMPTAIPNTESLIMTSLCWKDAVRRIELDDPAMRASGISSIEEYSRRIPSSGLPLSIAASGDADKLTTPIIRAIRSNHGRHGPYWRMMIDAQLLQLHQKKVITIQPNAVRPATMSLMIMAKRITPDLAKQIIPRRYKRFLEEELISHCNATWKEISCTQREYGLKSSEASTARAAMKIRKSANDLSTQEKLIISCLNFQGLHTHDLSPSFEEVRATVSAISPTITKLLNEARTPAELADGKKSSHDLQIQRRIKQVIRTIRHIAGKLPDDQKQTILKDEQISRGINYLREVRRKRDAYLREIRLHRNTSHH